MEAGAEASREQLVGVDVSFAVDSRFRATAAEVELAPLVSSTSVSLLWRQSLAEQELVRLGELLGRLSVLERLGDACSPNLVAVDRRWRPQLQGERELVRPAVLLVQVLAGDDG